MDNRLICSQCGYIGIPNEINKGSGGVELILWLFFIIPGVIYSVWRRSSKPRVCPSCHSQSLVPIASPVGRELVAKQGKTVDQAKAEAQKMIDVKNKKDKRLLLILCILVVGIIFLKIFFVSN
jgi:hypothetical protein